MHLDMQIALIVAAGAVEAVEELAFAFVFGQISKFALDNCLAAGPGFRRCVVD